MIVGEDYYRPTEEALGIPAGGSRPFMDDAAPAGVAVLRASRVEPEAMSPRFTRRDVMAC